MNATAAHTFSAAAGVQVTVAVLGTGLPPGARVCALVAALLAFAAAVWTDRPAAAMSRTPAPGYQGYYTHCRDCGERILMCRTQASNGQRFMPLNVEPGSVGNVAIDGFGRAVVTIEGNPIHAGELHQHHAATCPVKVAEREERHQDQLQLDERRGLQ